MWARASVPRDWGQLLGRTTQVLPAGAKKAKATADLLPRKRSISHQLMPIATVDPSLNSWVTPKPVFYWWEELGVIPRSKADGLAQVPQGDKTCRSPTQAWAQEDPQDEGGAPGPGHSDSSWWALWFPLAVPAQVRWAPC